MSIIKSKRNITICDLEKKNQENPDVLFGW